MTNPEKRTPYSSELSEFVPDALTDLIGSKGAEVVERVGIDVVKEVIADVLCGLNLRNSTEMLTRRRLGMLNAATLVMFLRGVERYPDLVERLPRVATAGLKETRSKAERWLLQWVIGLTTKGVQNVLRDSQAALDTYVHDFTEASQDIVRRCREQFGEIAADVTLKNGSRVRVTWDFFVSLFCTIGSQTLAIRGSEKSTYGKLFERLVLGSVLSILGFRLTAPDDIPPKPRGLFWLSSQFGTREADATLILKPGIAVRFDLGFIGRGNPEISKDKVSRFERQLEINEEKYYSTTFVIVDRVGERSKIVEQAERIGGVIIQMSLSQWPRALAKELKERHGFSHELLNLAPSKSEEFIRMKVNELDVTQFVSAVSTLISSEVDDPGEPEPEP
jgi:hypothetical protein